MLHGFSWLFCVAVVSISARDGLERLVSEVTYYVLTGGGALKLTHQFTSFDGRSTGFDVYWYGILGFNVPLDTV